MSHCDDVETFIQNKTNQQAIVKEINVHSGGTAIYIYIYISQLGPDVPLLSTNPELAALAHRVFGSYTVLNE